MKLRINYDLLEKIRFSKKGLSLKKSLAITYLPAFPLVIKSFYDVISAMNNDIGNKDAYLILLGLMLVGQTIPGTTVYLAKKFFDPNAKPVADNSLSILAAKLTGLDIITTRELLKESELLKTKYQIKYTDNKLPVLKQEKYISVPLTNGYSETLLQEHIIGSKTWDISVEEPEKKLQLKLAKAVK